MSTKKPSVLKIILRIACFGIVLWLLFYGGLSFQDDDTLKYDGDKYVPIQFSQDIFTYFYNGDEYFEEDKSYPIEGAQWEMLYNSGDLFCIKDKSESVNSYYADDANYEWFVTISDVNMEDETTYPITVTEDEIAYLNTVEDMPQETAIFFEQIEIMATLSKVSKDGIVKGATELAYYEGCWYWRSEIIDESREKDGTWPEYVYKLPESLTENINNAIK